MKRFINPRDFTFGKDGKPNNFYNSEKETIKEI
jgi:hypothetical protein